VAPSFGEKGSPKQRCIRGDTQVFTGRGKGGGKEIFASENRLEKSRGLEVGGQIYRLRERDSGKVQGGGLPGIAILGSEQEQKRARGS